MIGGALDFADDADVVFDSFGAFKRKYKGVGPDDNWHHIVEQNPANKARFGEQALQSTGNIVRLDRGTHSQLSALYSRSDFAFTEGETIRAWVSSQPYEYQADFGLLALETLGAIS